MKPQSLAFLVLIISAILLVGGCSNILDEEGQIQLVLSLDDHGFADTTRFSLSGSLDASKSTIERDLGSSLQPDPMKLAPGTWVFTVVALDANGVQQGQGSATCTVLPGQMASVSIGISYDYLVSFDLNYSGAQSNPESVEVVYANTYGTLPTPAERTGYTFSGWYDGPNADAEGITSNKKYLKKSGQTLYAHWTAKTYQVSFELGYDDAPAGPEDIQVTYDATYAALPTPPARTGYTFAGWYAASTQITNTSIASIANNQTLNAHWNPNTYSISFDANGGSGQENISVTYGSTYGTLPQPTREGYTFVDWCTDELNNNGYGYRITSDTIVSLSTDKTLYASWSPLTYTVSFDTNGGEPQQLDSKDITFGMTYGWYSYLPIPTRSGYTFSGWYTQDNEKVENTTSAFIAHDHTLYALWQPTSIQVNFDANGGNSVNPISVTYGSPYGNLALPTKEGYSFEGWYTSETDNNGSGSMVENSTSVSSTIAHTLYAKWAPLRYQVTFDANGGKITYPILVSYGSTYGSLPSPSREGYTFNGWYTTEIDNNGSGVRITSATTVSVPSNQILYAQWSILEATRVVLDAENLEITYSEGDSSTSVTKIIGLSTVGANGSTISWTSSDSSIISYSYGYGYVSRPSYLSGHKTIIMTAYIRYGETIQNKTFLLTVIKLDATDQELAQIDAGNVTDFITFSGNDTINSITNDFTLPLSGPNGTTITWSRISDFYHSISLSGAVATVTRPNVGSSNDSVWIQVKITKGSAAVYATYPFTVLAWTTSE